MFYYFLVEEKTYFRMLPLSVVWKPDKIKFDICRSLQIIFFKAQTHFMFRETPIERIAKGMFWSGLQVFSGAVHEWLRGFLCTCFWDFPNLFLHVMNALNPLL